MRDSKLADNVLSSAMNGENRAPFQSFGLAGRRRFEWLAMAAKPSLNNAVAQQALVHSTGNRLDLGQLRHNSILTDGWC